LSWCFWCKTMITSPGSTSGCKGEQGFHQILCSQHTCYMQTAGITGSVCHLCHCQFNMHSVGQFHDMY
jgi:hypothetical protein